MKQAAFAFRGYNVTNLGRTPELLAHPAYGEVMAAHLREASQVCADVVKRPVDLVARVREARETRGLGDYAEDVALIVAVEIAQIRILEQFFDISLPQARMAFGNSLGECSALIASGVYAMPDLLGVSLAMCDDCASLAAGVTLAVVFSRGSMLEFGKIRRVCLEVSQKGHGIIDISTHLSPNSLLLMGQNGTMNHFEAAVHQLIPNNINIRRHRHRFPPLHTPIMWQRSIPNRTALLLQTTPGGFRAPSVPLFSMVTAEPSYQEFNSRDLIHRWIDHPQRLWEIVRRVLADGIETVIHVGPAPNLMPATFRRLSANIAAQMQAGGLGGLGTRTLSHLVRRPWLTRILPSSTVLFRAPFVQQIILEDWLLEQRS